MHSTKLRVLILLITGLFALNALAQQTCAPYDVLGEYLEKKYPNETFRLAAYDHVTGRWIAKDWTGTRPLKDLPKAFFSVSASNEPTLIVPADSKVAVFVYNTNPVLYSTLVKSASQSDIAAIADLKKLVGLFGGFAGVTVADLAQTPRVVAPTGVAAAPTPPGAPPELPDLVDELNRIHDVLDLERIALATANKSVRAAADAVESRTVAITTAHDDAVAFLQLAEANSSNATLLGNAASLTTIDSGTETDYQTLRTRVVAAATVPASCPGVIAALNEAFKWKLDGKPIPIEEREAFDERWKELLKTLDGAGGECPSTNTIGADILPIATWLRNHPPTDNPMSAGEPRRILREARNFLNAFLKQVSLRGKQQAAADEQLSKRGSALKQAAQVALLAQLHQDYLGGVQPPPSACWLRSGVIEVQRATLHDLKLPFTKIQNEEMSIKIRPAFADKVEKRHAEVDKTYHFERQFDFDIDTGLVWTEAADREFKVAERPIVPTPATDPKTEKFPQQVSETTRAGKPALFLTARSKGTLPSLGLQIGFGLDTDNPSAYLGLGWTLTRYVKLSGGRTWQRVTRLGKGLELDKTLAKESDFNTREVFEKDWYLALSITLDNLSFFAPKE